MVDFNAEGMLSANKSHIMELIILGRRDELINTFQLYNEHKFIGDTQQEKYFNKLKAVLFSMFIELDNTLERKLKDEYHKLKKILIETTDATEEELLNAFFLINKCLDQLNLIKIDTRRVYDTTSIESENDEKGL